jgi:hypothetical protein
MSTLSVGTIQSNTTSPPTINNSAGTAIGTFCRAWVNFNGTGTVAIRASFNVTSITDNNTGDYTVNFTTAMPDANYAVAWSFGGTGGLLTGRTLDDTTARTTLLVRVVTANLSGTSTDGAQVNITVFR